MSDAMQPGREPASSLHFAVASAAVAVCLATTASAQTVWRIPATIGYAGAGAGLALAYESFRSGDKLGLAALGGTLGAAVGFTLGSHVDRALREGHELSGAQRTAMRWGTVFSGAVVGGAVAFAVPKSGGAGGLVDADAATDVICVVGGAVAGALIQVLVLDRSLAPTHQASLTVSARQGGVSVYLRLPL
jgi:hypothetical protein